MATTDLIIIRLLPNPPTDAGTFGRYLSGLVINAYDQNIIDADPVNAPTGYQELPLGTVSAATNLITFQDGAFWGDILQPLPTTSLQNAIIQHVVLTDSTTLAPPVGSLKAVATVVMTVNIQFPNPSITTTHHEYPTSNAYDIRLDIQRDGISLDAPEIEWNATCYTVSTLSPFAVDYMGIVVNGAPLQPGFPSMVQPSLYAIIPDAPAPLPSGTASILLSKDGTPPNFDNLLTTVDTVLGVYKLATGSKLENLTTPLTQQQCNEIAYEIAYNRAWFPLPPPVPKYPPPDGNPQGIEDLYTQPEKKNDQTRSQFEGNLTAYHAKLDSLAMKLSGYIFAASAAIDAERTSATSTMAQMTFPLDPAITQTKAISADVTVVLTSWDESVTAPSTTPIIPHFIVPAAYFYALGYQLPTNMSTDRYQATINVTTDSLTKTIHWAVNNGVLSSSEKTVAQTTNFSINTTQAIRRLSALLPNVVTNSQPMVYIDNVKSIVRRWRDNPTDDSTFWTSAEFDSAEYLNLMIQVVAGGDTALATDISNALLVPGVPLTKLQFAHQLPSITTTTWNTFFTIGSPPPPLPDYTAPGTTDYRIQAFIQKLKQIFSVGWEAPTHQPAGAGTVPTLNPTLTQDILSTFLAANPTFFDSPWTDTPATSDTQRWMQQMLKDLWTLVQVTNFTVATPPHTALTPALRMSYMEALYSRGLVSADRIAALSNGQFILATSGTVIESKDATTIYNLALKLPHDSPASGPEPPFGFVPANPGDLVNCIPPANLCPFGYNEYLHEMLEAESNSVTLLDVVSARRGNIATLHTTIANLETDVPEIDMVIESLEALGSGGTLISITITPAVGAVYDTPLDLRKQLGVSEGTCVKDATLLAALPAHSSPAIKIEKSVVYDKLKTCFTSPLLPFSRQLEISRRYLCHIGTDRFETMHRFRHDITEFAIDPTLDPVDFQKHVWRLPVRLDIGLEYLCISEDEYQTLYSNDVPEAVVASLYGIGSNIDTWRSQILILETFLSATGLSYCEFLCLQKSGWVVFEVIPTTTVRESDLNSAATKASTNITEESRSDNPGLLPDCPPCCLSDWRIEFGDDENLDFVLKQLVVFIRLWKTLNSGCRDKISFSRLADICTVLELFPGSGQVNPGFIQQLPSLIMLHDFFCLPWSDSSSHDNKGGSTASLPGSSRTKILALWGKTHSTAQDWVWAVQALLHAVQTRAETEFHCGRREAEFLKITADNLDPLSKLAGFSDTNPWHQSPACTIRFAEVLSKIYASRFTVGEILFLFTVQDHLDGDDPFPIASRLETLDRPLELPDDQLFDSLEVLRKKLLCVELSDEECQEIGWHKIESIIRDAGYSPTTGGDALMNLAEHFFPETLESAGQCVSSDKRQYSTPLNNNQTSPKIWSADPCIPFHYAKTQNANTDSTDAGELWTTIPLRDEDVFRKLQIVRQLRPAEITAVRNLYYMPRAALAPFALLFDNFGHAVERLVQEPCEKDRFAYFKRQVLLFHRRCEIISGHLTAHVRGSICRDEGCGCCGPWWEHTGNKRRERTCPEGDPRLAWAILKNLIADEDTAARPGAQGDPWQDDGGSPPPDFTWNAAFSGSAVAALLGLVGTGLKESVKSKSGTQWTEMCGGLEAFGHEKNKWNTPVPTLIPQLSAIPSTAQNELVNFKNGFAFLDQDEALLHGAEPFMLQWKGTLIVDCAGCYVFSAGRPRSEDERPHCEDCDDVMWLVTLQRGQQKFTLLSYGTEQFPGQAFVSREVRLEKGTYAIMVEFAEKEPKFDRALDIERMATGFQVKWEGPDTKDRCLVVPFCDLITDTKDGPLSVSEKQGGTSSQFQRLQYFSSLRDIRRTYQRAFKALLFARQFCLDAKERHRDDVSEIQYLLDNAQQFEGTSFYLTANTWTPHHAWLDFNFLPVGDPYFPPDPTIDSRANPSQKRQSALFDWWERMFDYTKLRDQMREVGKWPLWLLFQETGSEQPFLDLANLVRYLKMNPALMETLLNYSVPGNTIYTIASTDLLDERWATRLWLARQYVRHLVEVFYTDILENTRPALWVADDLEVDITIGQDKPESGLHNLVGFVQASILDSDECASRLSALREVNNGLRKHCRDALVAYLTQLSRVKLPDGTPITTPRQLSDLLLQDVEADLRESTTRILDAVSAVQKFVQRARIDLEPQFTVTQDFSRLWECKFASFETWVVQARRQLYGENWVQWEELKALEKGSEAGRLLRGELPTEVENLVEPGRPLSTPGLEKPKKGLEPVQNNEMVVLEQHTESTLENLTLLGTPDRDARPTLLAALVPTGSSNDNSNSITPTVVKSAGEQLADIAKKSTGSVPMWIESAIRLGTRFIRVAASGRPPAFPYTPVHEKACCEECGKIHVPSIDEYYFWLRDAVAFDEKDVSQNADIQAAGDDDPMAPAWNPPTQPEVPDIFFWPHEPSVVIYWTRVHAGQLLPPRRSAEGVRLDLLPSGSSALNLELEGRDFDSLFLTVAGRNLDPTKPSGTHPGFRYDLATDVAIVTPQIKPDTFPTSVGTGFGDFAGYPWFAYFNPGKPLAPPRPFGVMLALATRLKDNCQYEASLSWLRAAFDPLKRDNTWAMCQRNVDTSNSNTTATNVETVKTKSLAEQDTPFRDSPCCLGVTNQPSTLRSRAVFLEYLDTLLSWADQLAEAGSQEKAQQALVLLETMECLLGQAPRGVKAHPSPVFNTMTVANFTPSAPPLNPRLLKLYDEIGTRVSRMRHKIKGKGAGGCSSCSPGKIFGYKSWEFSEVGPDSCCAGLCPSVPCQPYRFTSIFPKAAELASLVKQLAATLVSAYERGDAEYLAALRQAHERTLLDLGTHVSQYQWRAADWDVQALGESMRSAITKLRYYRFLLNRNNVTGEEAYQTGAQTAMNSNSGANINEGMATVYNMIPDFAFGVAGEGPYQSTQIPIGQKMAGMASGQAQILNTVATIANTQAGLSLTQAGWQRRNEEWQHQIDLCLIEIAQIKRQTLAAQRRSDIAVRELNNHQRQLEHSEEVLDFMRDKFSRHSMFLFLQRETGMVLKGMFELALRTAHDAYQAFLFERVPTTPGSVRPFPSAAELWSGPFEGVSAGDRLELALRRLEREYMNNNCRELELNKRISLRESFPKEFIELRLWGMCEVDIKEWRFDEDHPGLWMRRLKSVALSLPCVAGAYTGVHARVRLMGSKIRTRPLIRNVPKKCCKPKHKERQHCCCTGTGDCNGDSDDPYLIHRFASERSSAALTATSHGQDDAGLFETNMRDERYLPFEFEGAISKWKLEMPESNNLFDFQSLADVVINLNYTAREGGDELKRRSEQSLGFGGPREGWWRAFEIRREFPDAWPKFEGNGMDWEERDRRHHYDGHHHREELRGEHHREDEQHHHHHHQHHQGGHCTCKSCQPTPPRTPSPRHHHGGHFDFALHLRRGMFPFLAPGPPPIRVTTLYIYIVLPHCHGRDHKICPKEKEDDDTCECGSEPREKKCCCPAKARHFPIQYIPPGQDECREKWRAVELVPHVPTLGILPADESKFASMERNGEVYQCEIGNLDLRPIGHDDRNRPMRGLSSGGEVYGHLRFPQSMGRVKEAWILCGFEPVLPGQVREGGCCDKMGREDRWKHGDETAGGKEGGFGERDDGKRRKKYFLDTTYDD